jgi:hypothetical protein
MAISFVTLISQDLMSIRPFCSTAPWMGAALLMACKAASPNAVSSIGSAPAVSSAEPASTVGDDPAGKRFDEWLVAINAGDPARIERVHVGAKDAEQLVSMDIELARRSGGFEVHHFAELTPILASKIEPLPLSMPYERMSLFRIGSQWSPSDARG